MGLLPDLRASQGAGKVPAQQYLPFDSRKYVRKCWTADDHIALNFGRSDR
jgi:hypothetical protein